jgi:integrase
MMDIAAPSPAPSGLYLGRLKSETSRRTQRTALRQLAQLITGQPDPRLVPWWRLDYRVTETIAIGLGERYAPATVNRYLCALRGVLRACWRAGLMSRDAYERAVDVEGVSAEREPAGRVLAPGELAALFASCAADDRPDGRRDAAVLALLFGAALRRAELAGLDLASVEELAPGRAVVLVDGKGRRQRRAFLGPGAAAALRAWLDTRGASEGPLVARIRRGGRIVHPLARLSPRAVAELCARRARAAGVASFGPHDARRTFVTRALEAGVDLALVGELVGHRDPKTTRRYDRRGDDAKAAAASLVLVPYLPPENPTHGR